jgi:hypothetical protein
MLGFPVPSSLPCPECGAAIAPDGTGHECDEQRRRWHELFLVAAEIGPLDDELREYLSSPQGRFEAFYAERQRLRRAA